MAPALSARAARPSMPTPIRCTGRRIRSSATAAISGLGLARVFLVGATLRDRSLAMLEPPTILHGPIVHRIEGPAAECDLRHLRPGRIDQRLARNGDQVGLALLQYVLGKERICD